MARHRVRVAALSMALAVLGSAACTGGDGTNRDVTRGAGPSRATDNPPPPARATVDATISPQRRPITLAFAGDVHFEGALASRLDEPATAFEPLVPELSAADLTIVNLETAVGTGGVAESKRFTFQAPPAAFETLAAAGVDVATMANNHAADYGRDGVRDALAAAAAQSANPPLAVVGIGGTTDEAFAPASFDIDGTSVAVLGASAADDDPTADPTGHLAATDTQPGTADAVDPTRLIRAVERARSDADVVVVYLHWGVQGESCPSNAQSNLARAVADAGADIVVGSHAHRLQGAGLLGDTYVAYGLGNFAWYTQASAATTATGVLTVTVTDGAVTDQSWAPARIGPTGLPEFATGAEAADLAAEFDQLRDCTDLDPLGR